MKRHLLHFVCLFTIVVCFPSMCLALNSGAHIYITEQIYGSDDIDLLYGSIAPDLAIYVPNPVMWESGFQDTHYNYIILKPQGWTEPWKRFAIGWMTHNEEWGVDWYSHVEYQYPNGLSGDGYVIDKANILIQYLTNLPEEYRMPIAHNAIEFAIDILIQDLLDQNLGWKLYDVAMNRSAEDIRRLFNILVAKNKVTDRKTLYQSEMIFRNLILTYSYALAESSSTDLEPLAILGSEMASTLYGVEIDKESVESLLQIAVAIIYNSGDLYDFLEDTIDGIRMHLGID